MEDENSTIKKDENINSGTKYSNYSTILQKYLNLFTRLVRSVGRNPNLWDKMDNAVDHYDCEGWGLE